jgi:methylated-DNA-[protein]-cysteine S-methyltransferase
MNNLSDVYQAVISSPFGTVGIRLDEGRLNGIEYLDQDVATFRSETPGLDTVVQQIEAYLDDPKLSFELDMQLDGTPFQRRVWRELQAIPPGETLTYGELAARIGSGARAVGNACRANPCPLVVPCHRVVARQGLGGFAGETSGKKLEIKRWLLHHEGWL